MGSLETGGDSDGDYSDEDDQGSETNGSMMEDYTDIATNLATDAGGNHGDKREMNIMRQQMEGQLSKLLLFLPIFHLTNIIRTILNPGNRWPELWKEDIF